MWWHHGWHLTSNILIYFLISYLLNAYLSHSKQTQLKLNQTTEFNDALIEATQAGVLILNAQGEYVSSTARVTDMLGIPMHQLQDIKLEQTTQFFPAALSTTIQDTQRDQQRRRLTVSFHTEKGTVWVIVSVTTFNFANENYLRLIFVDVTPTINLQQTSSELLNRANIAELNLVTISEEVQRRIGRELHDDLGQQLTGIAFLSEVLFKKLSASNQAEMKDAETITNLINQSISKTRYVSEGLFPAELKENGLFEMLTKLTAYVISTHQVKCKFSCDQHHLINDSETSIHLFRIAQEAINNAIRHGHAKNILIQLNSSENGITLSVENDGRSIGEDTGSHKGNGIGMRSMEYRANIIGATLNVSSPRRTGGTVICVNVPLNSGGNNESS